MTKFFILEYKKTDALILVLIQGVLLELIITATVTSYLENASQNKK